MASFIGSLCGNGREITRLGNTSLSVSASTWETKLSVRAYFKPRYMWRGRRGKKYLENEKAYSITLSTRGTDRVDIEMTEEQITNMCAKRYISNIQERLDRSIRLAVGDMKEKNEYDWYHNFNNEDPNRNFKPSYLPKNLNCVERYGNTPPNYNKDHVYYSRQ